MKNIFMKKFLVAGVTLLTVPASLFAQTYKKEGEKKDVDQIIINRVISKDAKSGEKVVIEIQGDNVIVNGKKIDAGNKTVQYGDVSVQRNKLKDLDSYVSIPGGQAWSLSTDRLSLFNEDENRAMLGVNTEYCSKGAIVVLTTKNEAAEKAGLKVGDIITSINGHKISETNEITEVIRKHKPGDKVSITYLRGDKEEKTTAELGKWKGVRMNGSYTPNVVGPDFYRDIAPTIDINDFKGEFKNHSFVFGGTPKLGISIQDTDEGKGVKVIELNDQGNAAKAGVKKDDVITHVNNKEVNSADEISKIIKENKDKASVIFKVQRAGKLQDIEVRMPRTLKSADL